MANGIFKELEWRGLIHQATDPGLGPMLGRESCSLYCGFDPTAPSLTTAHLMQILVLRRMQLAGHAPIALAGGGTGLVGDPSGRDTERTLMGAEQVQTNVATIRPQLERLLDFSSGSAQARLLNNADWLGALGLTEFLRDIGKHFSVNMMIGKDSVRARLQDREQGLSFAEFSYMLLQSYDFLYLNEHHGCRLQVGGSDQWGNITAGIDLIRKVRGEAAYGLTTPLLIGPNGKKMSKSEGGAVWLDPKLTSPYRFYQFWFNTEDASVVQFLKYFTFLSREKIAELAASMATDPGARPAQMALAIDMTTLVHGADEAAGAVRASKAVFGAEIAELDEQTLLDVLGEVDSTTLPRSSLGGTQSALVDLLVRVGLSSSRAEARQHLAGGGVYVNNVRVDDAQAVLGPGDVLHGSYVVLRRGKKTHHLLRFT